MPQDHTANPQMVGSADASTEDENGLSNSSSSSDSSLKKQNLVVYKCFCNNGFTGEDCSLAAVVPSGGMVAASMSSTVPGEPGVTHSGQGIVTSSVVFVAILAFVVGLVAIPLIKAFLDKRDKQRRLQIMEDSSSLEKLLRFTAENSTNSDTYVTM